MSQSTDAPPTADAGGAAEETGSTAAPQTRVNWAVFIGSAVGILAIAIWAIVDTTGAEALIGALVTWVSTNMGWYYFLVVTLVVIFVLVIALTRVGSTKLGPDHSRPQFNLFT